MLSIGAFAQIGQVTHRMLRHWDAAGLLVPAHVDEYSGYRSYDPAQLARLHRIVALRNLDVGLDDIGSILDQGNDTEHIATLLRIRRAELEKEQRVATARLVDVERRLHLIDKEKSMSHIEVVEKSLPAVRLAARRATVAEQPEIAGVIGSMFDAVADALAAAGLPVGSGIAQYDMTDAGLSFIAGYEHRGAPVDDVETVDLAPVDTALCAVHLGTMAHIDESWQALYDEVLARGFVPSGPCREVYLRAESEDQSDWVTELQQPVAHG